LPDSPGPNQAQEDGVDQPETLPRDASKSDRLASALAKAIENNRLGQQTQSFSTGGDGADFSNCDAVRGVVTRNIS
jgi:hypothetical protein